MKYYVWSFVNMSFYRFIEFFVFDYDSLPYFLSLFSEGEGGYFSFSCF